MSLDEFWDLVWLGPTQREVDLACSRVTVDALAEARAAHQEWDPKLSDVTVRALLVIEAVGRKRVDAPTGEESVQHTNTRGA